MIDQVRQVKTFWIKISAMNLPCISGADVDPVCVVSQSGRVLHKTEAALNDADPDFNVALKLDASVSRTKPLEFRIYDTTILELEDAGDDAAVLVSDDDIKRLTSVDHKSSLLHESFVKIETLESIIDNLQFSTAPSVIHKERDVCRKSDIFLSIFPIEDCALQVLDGDLQYLFDMQGDSDAEAQAMTIKHDPVLDVMPRHLCTIQNAVATVGIKDKSQESAKSPTDIMSLVLEAKHYKHMCLGSAPDSEKRAKNRPQYRYIHDHVAFSSAMCFGTFWN